MKSFSNIAGDAVLLAELADHLRRTLIRKAWCWILLDMNAGFYNDNLVEQNKNHLVQLRKPLAFLGKAGVASSVSGKHLTCCVGSLL